MLLLYVYFFKYIILIFVDFVYHFKNTISSRFLAKTLRANKPAMKKYLKNLSFIVDVKL